MSEKISRKVLTGTVVSDKMDKTIKVRVDRRFMHAKFKKVVTRSKKYSVHDEKNECQMGDFVSICETRPLSKTKRWRLMEVIERANPLERAEAS